MTPDEIASWVGAVAFNRVRRMLVVAFRSGRGPQVVSKEAVAAAIVAEWSARRAPAHSEQQKQAALTFLKDPPPSWSEPAPPAAAGQGYRYYDGLARHERAANEAPHSAFDSLLPMVRVPLPAASPGPTAVLAQTAIGTVFASDHLLTSVAQLQRDMNQRFGAGFGAVQRVDVVTPARASGRFGAIAVYLGYRTGDMTPSFYVLEAGLATGAPVRLYASRDLSPIVRAPTAYLPSPFVQLSNTYDGELHVAGDEPTDLLVRSYREPRDATAGYRVQVLVRYEPRTAETVAKRAPGDLTLVAAERIAAIGESLGMNAIGEQGLLAPAGRRLPWIREP